MFVVLLNHSKTKYVTPKWLEKVAAAFTKDLKDFCSEYGLAAWAVTTDVTMQGPRLAIFDKSTVPGALGYHDVAANGLPYGDAFADSSSEAELQETLSHELKELIGDLWADRWRSPQGHPTAYAEEACDAVQGTPYTVDGVTCANHVTQAWYQYGSRGPWDHRAVLSGDHQRTDAGYVIVMQEGEVSTEPKVMRHVKTWQNSRTRRRLDGRTRRW